MKSEPNEFSIDDLAKYGSEGAPWFGIRNYQARNFMLNEMQINDKILFWHSSCKDVGIYGIARVASLAKPDETQFDSSSIYYDPKSSRDKPRWWCVNISLEAKTNFLSITQLRESSELEDLQVLKRGNRLSITKVTAIQWNLINKLIYK